MGTNFYILGHTDTDSPEYHIGKRSAAGLYCWNCKTTLCKDGEKGIHTGKSEWHDKCPNCGAQPIKENLEHSAAGIELGFAKNLTIGPTVTTVCSFTWAMYRDTIYFHNPDSNEAKQITIEDEYGQKYTVAEFAKMLKDMCPIEFYDMIGREFS